MSRIERHPALHACAIVIVLGFLGALADLATQAPATAKAKPAALATPKHHANDARTPTYADLDAAARAMTSFDKIGRK